MKTQGVIFDFDGLIVDSEPLWQQAEIETFKTEGLKLTPKDCTQTTGLASFEAVEFWYNKLKSPEKEKALLTQEVNQKALQLLKDEGQLQPGVKEILKFWKSKKVPIGIASGSSMAHIKTILEKYDLGKYFNLIYSIDFERFGKPHPGIYISACKKLNIDPLFSVSFEDSFNGMLAGKAARMKVVAVLEKKQMKNTQFDFTDLKIESLINFGADQFKYLESLM